MSYGHDEHGCWARIYEQPIDITHFTVHRAAVLPQTPLGEAL